MKENGPFGPKRKEVIKVALSKEEQAAAERLWNSHKKKVLTGNVARNIFHNLVKSELTDNMEYARAKETVRLTELSLKRIARQKAVETLSKE
jgi:hypothetical protein